MLKWGKVLGIASIVFTMAGVGIFVYGLVHIYKNNQVSPDFVLATAGVVFAVNSGMLGLAVAFFNSRIDDLGKRIDDRFDYLELRQKPRGK